MDQLTFVLALVLLAVLFGPRGRGESTRTR